MENLPNPASDELSAVEASTVAILTPSEIEVVDEASDAVESDVVSPEQVEGGAEADAEGATSVASKAKPMHPREVLNILLDRYPAAFFPDPRKVKPLAVGVLQELRAACEGDDALPLKTQDLRRALRYYTQRAAYLRAVIRGEMRINLLGEAVAEVSADQKQHAEVLLAELEPKLPVRPERTKPAASADDAVEQEATRSERKPRHDSQRQDRKRGKAQGKSGGDAGRRPARAPREPAPEVLATSKSAEHTLETEAPAVEVAGDKLSQLLAKFAR